MTNDLHSMWLSIQNSQEEEKGREQSAPCVQLPSTRLNQVSSIICQICTHNLLNIEVEEWGFAWAIQNIL